MSEDTPKYEVNLFVHKYQLALPSKEELEQLKENVEVEIEELKDN